MIEQLTQWYSSLDGMNQVFWTCAIVSSAVFAIQLVLTMLGMDAHDVDVDFDTADFGSPDADTMDTGGGLSLFSIRSLINFFVGFGWAGVCLSDVIHNTWLLSIVAAVVGFLFVMMFFFIKRQTKKLEHNGAFNIADCEGKTASVYLRIPPAGGGMGKVQISLGGSVQEFNAFTLGEEEIPTGKKVQIVCVSDSDSLQVEAI